MLPALVVKSFPDVSSILCHGHCASQAGLGGRKASLKSLSHPGVREPDPQYPTRCGFEQDLARGDRSEASFGS